MPSEDARVLPRSKTRTVPPQQFRVLMHNDDYTTMEFVVQVLEAVFRKPPTEANQIMLNIHLKGVGLCGVYPHEIAETKVDKVHAMARSEGFPLRCSMEQV
ncbi:ATP-dependent Clp protease adapter ClpS [Desulfuromonas versatilis]